ncbi:MAG: hypothetical protein C5B50_29450 [Verrucomicrobia bacterium]|nr:MAG: hypothetical protein C5B50_29450 [Verrucomicrobiota bacterium]
MPTELQVLLSEITRDFPAARIEWDPFPSGVRVLSLELNGRMFELEYHPTRGTGVSENFQDTPPFIGHDEAFDSLDEAISRFKELLSSAKRGEKASRSAAMILQDKKR